jgi:hypothetical protein
MSLESHHAQGFKMLWTKKKHMIDHGEHLSIKNVRPFVSHRQTCKYVKILFSVSKAAIKLFFLGN